MNTTISGTANTTANTAGNRPSIISLSIKERAGLYAAYMPYLKNGGIFLPSTRTYKMGEEVFILLQLMDDTNKYSIAGKVSWITPALAPQNRTQGIGVEFSADENGKAIKLRIEELLGSALHAVRPTHTI